MGCPNSVEKTFTGGSKTTKFVNVFSLKSFSLYGSLDVFGARLALHQPSSYLLYENVPCFFMRLVKNIHDHRGMLYKYKIPVVFIVTTIYGTCGAHGYVKPIPT